MDTRSLEPGAVVGSMIKYVVLVLILLAFLFPIYWMVNTSFKTRLEITSPTPTLFPQRFFVKNYQDALTNSSIPRYMVNSVIIVGVSTLISLILGTLAGYSLARFPFTPSFKKNMSFWILSTRMVPPIVTVIPIFVIYQNLQLLNT